MASYEAVDEKKKKKKNEKSEGVKGCEGKLQRDVQENRAYD